MTDAIVQAIVDFLGGFIPAELTIFIISLLPILELRGGLLAASTEFLNVHPLLAVVICVVGNLLPIPFILWLIRPFFEWLRGTRHLKKVADWMERKVEKNKDKVLRYETFGLLLFVGIPLPGTGAWTGSLIAAMLGIPLKKSIPAICGGVLLAAAIMMTISYGILPLFGWLVSLV